LVRNETVHEWIELDFKKNCKNQIKSIKFNWSWILNLGNTMQSTHTLLPWFLDLRCFCFVGFDNVYGTYIFIRVFGFWTELFFYIFFYLCHCLCHVHRINKTLLADSKKKNYDNNILHEFRFLSPVRFKRVREKKKIHHKLISM